MHVLKNSCKGIQFVADDIYDERLSLSDFRGK